MINLQKFGQIIAQERLARSMTQSQLSKVLLVTPQAISKWERGESFPDIETLVELCLTFEINIDYLLNQCFESHNLVSDICPDNIEEHLRSSHRKEVLEKYMRGELKDCRLSSFFYLLNTHERLTFIERFLRTDLPIDLQDFLILLSPPERIRLLNGLQRNKMDLNDVIHLLNPLEKMKYNLL